MPSHFFGAAPCRGLPPCRGSPPLPRAPPGRPARTRGSDLRTTEPTRGKSPVGRRPGLQPCVTPRWTGDRASRVNCLPAPTRVAYGSLPVGACPSRPASGWPNVGSRLSVPAFFSPGQKISKNRLRYAGPSPIILSCVAGLAQLVARHLAKVEVAGSIPVARSMHSSEPVHIGSFHMARWPSGKAEACKAFIPGSNPGLASKRRRGHPTGCPLTFSGRWTARQRAVTQAAGATSAASPAVRPCPGQSA